MIEVSEISEEEKENIISKYNALRDSVTKGHETTLEEFKNIVVPYVRLHRETQFVLHEKEEKVKRVTKKRVMELLTIISDGNMDTIIDEREQEAILSYVREMSDELAAGNKVPKKDRIHTIHGLKWKEYHSLDLSSSEASTLSALSFMILQ